jgi:hypothetical protein
MSRRLLRGLGRRLLAWSGAVAPAFPPGHFYSPIVDPGTVERTRVWPHQPDVLGIDFNDASHVRILRDEFPRFMPQFDYPQALKVTPTLSAFFRDNVHFGMLDAPALFVLLRAWKPRRIVEVGSGFSTLLMADVNRRFLGHEVSITCIDPCPPPFLRRAVDGIAPDRTSRAGIAARAFHRLAGGRPAVHRFIACRQDRQRRQFLFFEVFPRLASGVLIHLHDVFLPHDYPPNWVLGENRS